MFTHIGSVTTEGVDIRAEVGLLTRNIKIYGETSTSCFNSPICKYFSFDIYGGQIKVNAVTYLINNNMIFTLRLINTILVICSYNQQGP